MSRTLDREIVAIDLRNHGESPHDPEASYEDLAGDVVEFVKGKGWSEVGVVGHSMGGKVAMALTLSGSIPLSHLVVVDMSPARGPISNEFASYLEAMKAITQSHVTSRKAADHILQSYEPDLSIRQFLLTNLVLNPSTKTYEFRIPLDFLFDALGKGEIGGFPYLPLEGGEEGVKELGNGVMGVGERRRWGGRALFLKGSKSKYINKNNIPVIKAFFPNYELVTLDAGHWVHAERPKEFMEALVKFL